MQTENTQSKLPSWEKRKRLSITVKSLAAFSENGNWIAESEFGSNSISIKAIKIDASAAEIAVLQEKKLSVNEVQAFRFRPNQTVILENDTAPLKLDSNELFVCDRRASFVRRFIPALGQIRPLEIEAPTALCFDHSGRYLACGSENGTVTLFDLNLEGALLYERSQRFKPYPQNCAVTNLIITGSTGSGQVVGLNAQGKGFSTSLKADVGGSSQRAFHRFSARKGQLFTLADLGGNGEIAVAGDCPVWIHNLCTGDVATAPQNLGEYVYFARLLKSDELLLAGKKGLELHSLTRNEKLTVVERIWHNSMPNLRLAALYEDAGIIVLARTEKLT